MYIGAIPTPAATESRQEFTATANQTVFNTTGGTVGYCDCYLNGVKMTNSDFSFDGSTVTLTTGAAAGDVLAVVMRQADNALVALPIKDSAGNNVLSESGSVVTLTADEANVGSNAFVVDSSGNVGIGTSSPQGFFDVSVIPSGARRFEISYENSLVSIAATSGTTGTNRIENLGIYGDSIRFYVDNTTTEGMRIDSSGNINLSNNLNFARVRPTNQVSIADDASIQVASSQCGSSIISVYDFASGHGISCFVCYATTAIIVGNSANATNSDTDNKICIFKSANSHTTYVKNRLGSTRTFSISVMGAYTQT